jgi:hypothetical protein
MTSLSQRRSGARNGARLAEAAIREEKQRQHEDALREADQVSERRRAAREAEKVRPKLTADDVRGGRFVRDSLGWHKVVRVSAKSVTVETAYSWTDRIALDKVLEVRS